MYSVDFLCEELIKYLHNIGYRDITITRYKRGLNIFRSFCSNKGITIYTKEIGFIFANDVISERTKKYSNSRRKFRGTIIRFFNYYLDNDKFELIHFVTKEKFDNKPLDEFQSEYLNFKNYIFEKYSNHNTRNFYTYEVFIFLKYLGLKGLKNLEAIDGSNIFDYLSTVRENRQRAAICSLKYYFKFLNNDKITKAIAGVQAIRKKKLIPFLNEDEVLKTWNVLNNDNSITYKEKALFLLAFTLGIRACDIVNLKLSDINWDQDYISFIQQKTGNAVCLPLSPVLGNSLYNYIIKERKKTSYKNLFISDYPPFKPYSGHSACYHIVKKIINKANIDMKERFCGVHFLRHNVASNMVNKEIPLETIAAVLGHASPVTTGIYITTDISKLRDCVLSINNLGGDYNV